MSYSDVASTIAIIVSIVAIPATYFNGVRVGRVNDKRKEFNRIADKIHLHILKVIREIDGGYYPNSSVKQEDIDLLLIHSAPRDRDRILQYYDHYISILRENAGSAMRSEKMRMDSIPNMRKSLEELSKFVQHK